MGLLNTPRSSYRLDGVKVWAADNGCFTNSYPGDAAFIQWLRRYDEHKDRCLFVAAPDVVGDAEQTLAAFPAASRRLREAGWPVALVAQDGMTPSDVPWHLVDWLFIGGSTAWKMGDAVLALIAEAKRQNVGVHVGRVNSYARFCHFAAHNADTCDGTYIAFGPAKNAPKVRRWMATPQQMALPQVGNDG